VTAVETDAVALAEAGLKASWGKIRTGKREAKVAGLGESMGLEWVADSDFRFFPAQRDELFGYVLHPVDLATNKASAAADRREPRDLVDLVTIHENNLPLGAVICAAVGCFPGFSPEEMLAEITPIAVLQRRNFECWRLSAPWMMPDLHRRIRAMLEDAELFITRLPSEAVGFVFLDRDKPVQPDIDRLARYQRRPGARRGVWPSSSEISSAMLERYGESEP
jgi:hypothetical protein